MNDNDDERKETGTDTNHDNERQRQVREKCILNRAAELKAHHHCKSLAANAQGNNVPESKCLGISDVETNKVHCIQRKAAKDLVKTVSLIQTTRDTWLGDAGY